MTKTKEEYQAEIDELIKKREKLNTQISYRVNKIKAIEDQEAKNMMSTINFNDIDSITTEQWKYILYHFHGISKSRYEMSTNVLEKFGISSNGITGGKRFNEVKQFAWGFHNHYDFSKYKSFYFRVKDALNFFPSEADDETDVWTIYLYINMFETRWSDYSYYLEIRKIDNMCRVVDLSAYSKKNYIKTDWMTFDEAEELINKYKDYEVEDNECYC